MLTSKTFYFLRHGETDWNRQRIIQGQTDTALNATGLSQAAAVKAEVEKLPIATICCSPLLRARRTTEIVNAQQNTPVVYLPDLMEVHLGIYQGHASNGEWREPWAKGGPMPEGETFADYTARVIRGFNQALTHPGPVLIVAHGGNFWALEHYGLIGKGTRVTNCALFKLDPPAESKVWNVTQLACPEGQPLVIGEGAA
jgi:broad specificity phosphatase PhoE